MSKRRNVAIYIFDDAEVLDFAGPFEVFSVTDELNDFSLFNVFTVGETMRPIRAVNGLSVNPKFDFNTCPSVDILILAGGNGTREQIKNKAVLDWIAAVHQKTEFTLSICSGSRMLGVIGFLDDQPYCTHHQVYEAMKDIVPDGLPQIGKRFVRAGKVFTSGGISAGIDLSFHLVELLHGAAIANGTAAYMEYERERERERERKRERK